MCETRLLGPAVRLLPAHGPVTLAQPVVRALANVTVQQCNAPRFGAYPHRTAWRGAVCGARVRWCAMRAQVLHGAALHVVSWRVVVQRGVVRRRAAQHFVLCCTRL